MNANDFEQLPLEPETVRPRKGDEPQPLLGWPEQLGESKEHHAKPIMVWYVRDDNDLLGQASSQKTSEELQKYNATAKEDERPTWFVDVPERELAHAIDASYGRSARPANFPDIVVVDSARHGNDYSQLNDGKLKTERLQHDLRPLDEITAAVEHFHNRLIHGESAYLFDYRELIDPIESNNLLFDIDEKVFSPVYNETYRSKKALTREMLIDCGFGRLYLDENRDMESTLKSVWAYMNDHDETHLRKMLTDEQLRAAFEQMSTFDADIADEDYHSVLRMDEEKHGGFANWNEYKKYQRAIALAAKKLKFEEVKEEMRARYLQLLKEGVERIAGPIVEENDRLLREQRLIRPVVVSLSPNSTFQRHAIEHGANMIPGALEEDDIERMVVLAEKMRESQASVERERTRRTKNLFYRAHEGDLGNRSELTADTEQELGIVTGILEEARAKEVLDVGCGDGRIAAPLARKGFSITGIEANETFRKRAAEKIGSPDKILAGDVIDYRGNVPAEHYDAVTYTWHTILEAYGIGNTMQTLVSAWRALKPGGMLIFDQPTRENKEMEDGWYGDKEGRHYLAYLMTKEELGFTLRMAGFDEPEIHSWTTKPTELYPEGMKKWTIVAKKPLRNDSSVKGVNL